MRLPDSNAKMLRGIELRLQELIELGLVRIKSLDVEYSVLYRAFCYRIVFNDNMIITQRLPYETVSEHMLELVTEKLAWEITRAICD